MKYLNLVFKNIRRNILRTILTVLGISASVFLIIFLMTVLAELHRGSERANPLRVVARHAVSLTFDFPYAYRAKVAAVPGVEVATPFCWYGGIWQDERNFFATFAVDEKDLRKYQPELVMSDPEWDAFIKDRQGAIVGAKLSTLYGFKPGQRITLRSPIYNNEIELIIDGIYTGGDARTLFFHYDYFNESNPPWAKDKVGMLGILARSVDDVPKISQTVDAMFVNTEAPTKTETEREFAMSFEAMAGGVKQFMYGIIAAIVFSLLLVMANSMAMTVRERTREVGTLKALGFQRGTIAMLFVLESLFMAVMGAVLGIGAAVLLFGSIDISLYVPNMISFMPDTSTLVAAFFAAVLVGMASVAYSAFRVSRLTIAEALRRVE